MHSKLFDLFANTHFESLYEWIAKNQNIILLMGDSINDESDKTPIISSDDFD